MKQPAFDALTHLRAGAVFRDLEESVLQELSRRLTAVDIDAGETLITEGDPAGDAWIVVHGRLAVTTGDDAERRMVAELGPGSVVGEMSLLSGSPRSASVRALRDTRLLRLSEEDFGQVVLDDPRVLLQVARTVVRRLDRSIHGHRSGTHLSAVSVIPAGRQPKHRTFAARFAETVGPFHDPMVLDRGLVEERLGVDPSEAQWVEFLHRVETDHDLTLLVADEADTEWTRRCMRHADLHLLVGERSGLTERNPAEALLASMHHDGRATHLVILHGGGSPVGTASLLATRSIQRHHHLRLGSSADLERLGRILNQTSIGLVLGGGGARGFAHLGVVKALLEEGIPIDHVSGSSIGSSVAGGLALGWDWEQMVAQERMVTVDRGSLIDFSFPAVALATGAKLTSGMRSAFGEAHIDDAWIDFFCVSTDLSSGELNVHRTGPLWQAVRASVAIPGIFPPVRSAEGHVLVDGGVLNNLPTDVMGDLFRPATLIASDLRAAARLPSTDLSDSGILSGWRVARSRLAPWKDALHVPRMIDLLSGATAVTGHYRADSADLVFRPPVDTYAILEFQSHAAILDAGYRHAVEVIEGWDRPDSCGPLLSDGDILARLTP